MVRQKVKARLQTENKFNTEKTENRRSKCWADIMKCHKFDFPLTVKIS